jgi:hypothetical protein
MGEDRRPKMGSNYIPPGRNVGERLRRSWEEIFETGTGITLFVA